MTTKNFTIAIIKPNVAQNDKEAKALTVIIEKLKEHNLVLTDLFRTILTKEQAEAFYQEHKDKPFFSTLIDFMTSAPVTFLKIDGEKAVESWREIIGATAPKDRKEGCLRQMFGDPVTVTYNGFHGSDSEVNAEKEWEFMKQIQATNQKATKKSMNK